MSLDVSQQEELEKPVTRVIYFIEMNLTSATQRLSTFNQPITWGGFSWAAFGQVLDISTIEEQDGVDPQYININLTVKAEYLAIAIGPVEEYRGKRLKIYMCPMDESFQLVGTPALAWSGYMDTMTVGINDQEGRVELKCETAAFQLKRRPTYRLNSAQHKKLYPNDTGFDYLVNLIANPQLWLSKKFQSR